MKVGDLVVVVWTEDTENSATPVCGIVMDMKWPEEGFHLKSRQQIKLYCEGRYQWLERGDLRAIG